jgi:hypothetical protein
LGLPKRINQQNHQHNDLAIEDASRKAESAMHTLQNCMWMLRHKTNHSWIAEGHSVFLSMFHNSKLLFIRLGNYLSLCSGDRSKDASTPTNTMKHTKDSTITTERLSEVFWPMGMNESAGPKIRDERG